MSRLHLRVLSPLFRRLARLLAIALILCSSALPLAARAADLPSAPATTSASESAEGFLLPDYQDPAIKHDDNPVANAVGFGLKFAIVIGLIYGISWLYKKGMLPRNLMPGGMPAGSGKGGMSVLDSMPLRGAQSVHMIQVGDRTLVVGSNGKETMVKLAEWTGLRRQGGFNALIEEVARQGEEPESDFSDELESTIRQVIERERGE